MGIVKSRWLEDQERGWSSFDDKFACPECFEDPDIREFIQQIACEHECSYCGKSPTDEPIAADMNEIMEFIMEGVQVEWGDPNDEGMSWESREGGWLGRVLDSDELFDEIGFYTANDKLYRDICGALGDRLWCQRNLYGLLPQQELFSDWKYFCYVVTYETRFVLLQDERQFRTLLRRSGACSAPSHFGYVRAAGSANGLDHSHPFWHRILSSKSA